MTTIYRFLRHHLHFISIVPLLIIAVTWPVFPNMFDASTFWLPTQSWDNYMKFWDVWYGKSLLAGNAYFYFTDLLFHPVGLSLDFHNFSLPHMVVAGALQGIINADDAHSLTYMMIILVNTCSCYVVLLAWFRNKWVALAGAIAFGLHPYIIGHAQHPDVTLVACIPLALHTLLRGINGRHTFSLLISAVLVGITAFIGMYIFVCLLILYCFCILYLASRFWRNIWFWRDITVRLM